MPPPETTAAVSLALSTAIVVVAGLLLVWLWYQRRDRDPDLAADDASHFARQDFRRSLVAFILMVLAFIIYVGSPMDAKVAGKANVVFVVLWLAAFGLIFSLLILAMFDWIATRIYADRHLQKLARERLEILREERQRLANRDAEIGNGPMSQPEDHPSL